VCFAGRQLLRSPEAVIRASRDLRPQRQTAGSEAPSARDAFTRLRGFPHCAGNHPEHTGFSMEAMSERGGHSLASRAPRPAPQVHIAGALEDPPWPYVSGTFRALDFVFSVRSTDEGCGRHIDEVLAPLRTEGSPGAVYSVIDRGEAYDPRRRYALYLGDERVAVYRSPELLWRLLMWSVNQQAVRSSGETHVVLHAAAAERNGCVLVLPAPMESGKTTTVAALIRVGFDYLTDEATAIDRKSLRVLPYPKPLSIDRGSWQVLADLRPPRPEMFGDHWQVDPRAIRGDALGLGGMPRFIVVPDYQPGASSALEPVKPADMLIHTIRSTFEFESRASENIATLARTVRRSGCYRLTIGDLDEAVRLLGDLVDSSPWHAEA
jgi:hypothetical protein